MLLCILHNIICWVINVQCIFIYMLNKMTSANSMVKLGKANIWTKAIQYIKQNSVYVCIINLFLSIHWTWVSYCYIALWMNEFSSERYSSFHVTIILFVYSNLLNISLIAFFLFCWFYPTILSDLCLWIFNWNYMFDIVSSKKFCFSFCCYCRLS